MRRWNTVARTWLSEWGDRCSRAVFPLRRTGALSEAIRPCMEPAQSRPRRGSPAALRYLQTGKGDLPLAVFPVVPPSHDHSPRNQATAPGTWLELIEFLATP